MEYMLFICRDPTAPEYVAAQDNIVEWWAEMEVRGGASLRPVEDATTIAVRAGEVVVSDGHWPSRRNGSPAMTPSLVPILMKR